MSFDDKINYIKENLELKNKLKQMGFCPIYLKGDKGDIGPTGPKGESPFTIKIGDVETTTDIAEVANTGTDENIILSFKIPKGDKGEIGPTGPKGDSGDYNIGAFGEKYLENQTTLNLTANIDKNIPLENKGIGYFTDYTATNGIEIKKFGSYQIIYFITFTSNVDTTITLSLESDNNLIAGSKLKVKVTKDKPITINGVVITGLAVGEIVTMVISSLDDATLTFDDTLTAKISLIKLDS